jgi:thiaminase
MLIYAPSRRDLVAKLIEENQDVWKELINNKFCRAMKESTRGDHHVLRGFEWYMMQDYYYVASLIEYEAARVPKAQTANDLQTMIQRVSDTAKYTDHFFKAVTAAQPQGMGISTSTLLSTNLCEVLKKYIDLIIKAAEDENEVLSMVAMIVSLQSYYALASDLYKYSDHHDTLWYKFWAEDNFGLGKSCLQQQKFFIDNYRFWKDDMEKITKVFRETCKLELELWEEAWTHAQH